MWVLQCQYELLTTVNNCANSNHASKQGVDLLSEQVLHFFPNRAVSVSAEKDGELEEL